jgi:NADH-quinone oxidoreductase subunit M
MFMNAFQNPLVILTFLPIIGVILILFFKEENRLANRLIALITSLAVFACSIWVLTLYHSADPNPQLVIDIPWLTISGIPIDFHLGLDGINILLVLLTAFITPLAILATWKSINQNVKAFMLIFLLLELALMGVFLSFDMVLFYVFWEFTLVPMYFLIGIWGGERRVYAAYKFFLFTMVGSVLMLLGIIYIGSAAHTFSIQELIARRDTFASAQLALFIVFGLAFAIKVPIFPLHTWLPDAHVEAPTAASVILAAILLKMGSYGLVRFNLSLFPQATWQASPTLAILAVIGIIYGAAVALAQKDVKKLVAYSSVSHMGFVVLGIFALTSQSLEGAMLQMVNHGLSTGALFLIVGFLYERRHTRNLADFGGIWKVMPILGAMALVVTLSSAALPGTNGFAGEFNILMGAYQSPVLAQPWFVVVASIGVILAAVYLFVMFEKVFLGPVTHAENQQLPDLDLREIFILAPILLLIFWIGLYPQPFFNLIHASATQLLAALP